MPGSAEPRKGPPARRDGKGVKRQPVPAKRSLETATGATHSGAAYASPGFGPAKAEPCYRRPGGPAARARCRQLDRPDLAAGTANGIIWRAEGVASQVVPTLGIDRDWGSAWRC